MNDNKTAHMAAIYDEKIKLTIPNYELFHTETVNLVKTINPSPEKWLDTGCGTGTFVLSAVEAFRGTKFVLTDPSNEMLDIAKDKLSAVNCCNAEFMQPVSSQDLNLPDESFDVITAIQAHHYLDANGRKAATENCFRMLKPGGVFITFENIRPLSDTGIKIGLDRWKHFQMSHGKSAEEAEKHVGRFDAEYFPITITEYIELLGKSCFLKVELFWFSYMQAGFYAVKE